MILTFDIIILFLVISLAIVMFAMEVVPMEVTAMAAMGCLLLTGVITPEQAIEGFSNKAVVTIGCMFVISRSLSQTGFLEVFADKVYKSIGENRWLTIFIFFLTISLISGFINNTAAVAIFIPLAINLCQKFHISPTRVLLPLSYAAIFGGTLTLVGTSTNLVVSAVMEQEGMQPFRMFEFTKLGIIFMLIGLAYNMIIARWMLPTRSILSSLARKYRLGRYLTEFRVSTDSPLIGRTHDDERLGEKYDLQLYMIIRDGVRYRFNLKSMEIRAGDIFLVHIDINSMVRFKEDLKMLLLSDVKMTHQELAGKNHVIVEAIISQGSALIGKSLQQFDFRSRTSGFVLAIRRHGENLMQKIAHIRLKFSDTLLVLIPKDRLDMIRNSNDLILVEELDLNLRYERYWWLSIVIIPFIMILAAMNVIPLVKGAVLGVILLLILRTMSVQDAYNSISWPVIFLIAALVPVGTAIRSTGADVIIGKAIISLGDMILGPDGEGYTVYLSILYLASFFLSAFISNTAIAIVMTPIAIALGNSLGIDSRPLLVAVAFGASASFMTPMGYQTNLMVYGPGQYRFWDFVKAGLPLTLIFWGIATYFIPRYWSF